MQQAQVGVCIHQRAEVDVVRRVRVRGGGGAVNDTAAGVGDRGQEGPIGVILRPLLSARRGATHHLWKVSSLCLRPDPGRRRSVAVKAAPSFCFSLPPRAERRFGSVIQHDRRPNVVIAAAANCNSPSSSSSSNSGSSPPNVGPDDAKRE